MIDILNVRDENHPALSRAARHSAGAARHPCGALSMRRCAIPLSLADVQRQRLRVEGPSTGEEIAAVAEKLAAHIACRGRAARRSVEQLQMRKRMRHFAVPGANRRTNIRHACRCAGFLPRQDCHHPGRVLARRRLSTSTRVLARHIGAATSLAT